MKKTILTFAACLAALGLQAQSTFYGNGDSGFGGSVGNGNLVVGDDGTSVTFTFNAAAGLGGNDLVIYLDTVAGGFASTSGFNDAADGGRSAVSGYSGSGQSVMTFAGGFAPEYAIDIQGGFASLFTLANGGNNSLTWLGGTGQSGSPYVLTISLSSIGLTPGAGQSFNLFGTLVSESGYRSTEAIAGNATGTQGWNAFTQTGFETYTTTAVPEPSTLALCGLSGLALFVIRRRRH